MSVEFIQNDEVDSDPVVKKRHGCLSVFLILILLVNALATFTQLTAFFFSEPITNQDDQSLAATIIPRWFWFVIGIGSLIKLLSLIAIINWKKWGFWFFTLSTFVNLGINLYTGLYIENGITGLIGVAILYGVLHIGGNKKGWTQLD